MKKLKFSYILIQLYLSGALFYWTNFCAADIYKYIDENGKIYFTNTPNNKKFMLVIKEGHKYNDRSRKYDSIISNLCEQYNVDVALVKAVIKAESDFNPRAVSNKGAKGLMQLMPHKIKELDVSDPFYPNENIEGGIRYLRKLLDQFDGDLTLTLAAYNAGENNVLKYNNIPPFKETQDYVTKVLYYLRHYQRAD